MSGKDIGKPLFPGREKEGFPPPDFDAATRPVRFYMRSGATGERETWTYSKAKKAFSLREHTSIATISSSFMFQFRFRWDEHGKELPRSLRAYADTEDKPLLCLAPAVVPVHTRPGTSASAFTLPQWSAARILDLQLEDGRGGVASDHCPRYKAAWLVQGIPADRAREKGLGIPRGPRGQNQKPQRA